MQENNKVILSVGSNIHATNNIKSTFDLLCDYKLSVKSSSIYHSYPINKNGILIDGHPNFANAAFLITTCEPISKIMQISRSIENTLGREKTADKFTNIPIDIDLIAQQVKAYNSDSWVAYDITSLQYDHILLPLCELDEYFKFLLACNRYQNVFAISDTY